MDVQSFSSAKPQQEYVYNITHVVWGFCINYVGLNQITMVLLYPIQKFNNVSGHEFGDRYFYWVVDCSLGYHQVNVNKSFRCNLAFANPINILSYLLVWSIDL